MAFGGSLGRVVAGVSTGGLSELALNPNISSGLDNVIGGLTGENAADAAKEAAEIQAEAQREQLEYLKEINAIPQAFMEGALTQLGAYYGIGVDPETGGFIQVDPTAQSQQQMIEAAKSSPLYQSILSGRQAGEESLARSAAVGSGLRGGATTSSLINYNTQLQNEALLQGFNQQQQMEQQKLAGLGALARTPTYGQQIGQTMANIGQTQAAGVTAGAMAQQQAMGNLMNLGGTLGAAAIMSDERLKTDLMLIGPTQHPDLNRYDWQWKPESGKEGREQGFLAQDVQKVWPDLVTTGEDGYLRIYKDEVEARLKEFK